VGPTGDGRQAAQFDVDRSLASSVQSAWVKKKKKKLQHKSIGGGGLHSKAA
jgi:hypothetical protein